MNFINQVITEQDIEVTLRDFETYCRFVEERKPKLTPARSELGKKECFELDKLLTYSKGFDSPKYLQVAYPSINLWFHVSTAAGFFGVEAGKGANRILVPTKRLELFRELNSFSQYLYLFRIFWTKINWDELYYDTMDMIGHFFYIQLGFHALKEAIPGERIFADIDNFDECYDRHNPIHRMFVGAGIVIHHLQDFGFWRYERAYKPRLYFSERDIDVKAITPTKLGMVMINCCLKRPLEMYNMFLEEESIRSQWSCESVVAAKKKIVQKIFKESVESLLENESGMERNMYPYIKTILAEIFEHPKKQIFTDVAQHQLLKTRDQPDLFVNVKINNSITLDRWIVVEAKDERRFFKNKGKLEK